MKKGRLAGSPRQIDAPAPVAIRAPYRHIAPSTVVILGLDPRIHECGGEAWILGSSPRMTKERLAASGNGRGYLQAAQKRWMRLQASSSSASEVA